MIRTLAATAIAGLAFLAVAQAAPAELSPEGRAEAACDTDELAELRATVNLLEDVALDQQLEIRALKAALGAHGQVAPYVAPET